MMNSGKVKCALGVAVLLCGAGWPAKAQSVFGAIVGSVRDPSGAAVAGAMVKLRNVNQSLTREGAANGQGDYDIRNLPPGTYSVTLTSNGFREFRSEGIQLEARKIVRLDATLQLGELAQEVTISAAAGVVTTDALATRASESSKGRARSG